MYLLLINIFYIFITIKYTSFGSKPPGIKVPSLEQKQ
jgi:hypothetical protein